MKISAEKYSIDDLIDEFLGFSSGGIDTTGQFLQMLLYYVDKNSEIRHKMKT